MSRILKDKTNQITKKYGNEHTGIDVVGKEGWPEIIAHSDGIVCAIQDGEDNNIKATGVASYGNYVQIKHLNNMYTLYAHLKKGLKVKKGQNVKKGQVLGTEGNSGYSLGAHLHFEVRNKDNYVIDPTPYIDADLPNLPSTVIPKPVEKNENENQIEVLINDLRARLGFGLDKEVLGFVSKGIYQIYAEEQKNGYKWLKISENNDVWIAYSKEWSTIYEIKDYKELYEKELLVNKDLQSQVNNLNQTTTILNEKIKNAIDILNK